MCNLQYASNPTWSERMHLVTIHHHDAARWNTSHVLLPRGVYHVVFEAVLGNPRTTEIYIDNVTVLEENCTEIIYYTGRHC